MSAGRTRLPVPRRRVLPRWLKPALKGGVVTLLIGGLGLGLGYLWRVGMVKAALDGSGNALVAATAEVGLAVGQVLVQGRTETDSAELLKALDVTLGQPILTFDPEQARQRLERLAWVREARVERRLPNTVFVRLTEREPMALWQRSGKLYLVDREGAIVLRRGLERFGHLPIIVGDDAPQQAPMLLDMLAGQPDLRRRVVAAIRVGERRWNIRLDNGVEVQLPESGAAGAWAYLAGVERDHKVLARDVQTLDLRLPDRLVIRAAPEVGRRPGPADKQT